jgi:hypothetical protein
MKGYKMQDTRCRIQVKRFKNHGSWITNHTSCVRNESGIALAMALILSVIVLAIITGLLYMITSTTQISGMQKRYKTALEAGIGGSDAIFQLISTRGDPFDATTATYLKYLRTTSDACLTAKLNSTTDATNWGACAAYAKATSLTIDPNDPASYDMQLKLGDPLGINPKKEYIVYSKIVDTVEGNSGGDEGLLKSGVVNANTGEVTVMSVPYIYTIEVEAENAANPSERAKLSVLYQY